MDNKILLVVDVQNAMVDDKPYNVTEVIDNIKQLIAAARASKTEVVYVRHDDGKGSIMGAGTVGWQIYPDIAPEENEKIFDKTYNSAFKNTGLKEYLDGKGINNIILTGMQTEYCIDTTCKCAFEYGYKIIIPENTNTTYDCEFLSGEKLYRFYNNEIWDGRFAEVIPMAKALTYLNSFI